MINSYDEALREAINGNNEGLAYLYEKTYYDKYYIALKYMGNEQDAQDVLQDAYVSAWNKLSTLKEPEKFPAWFGVIVANTAKNALIKKKPMLFSELATESEKGEYIEYEIEDDCVDYQPERNYTIKETQQLVNELLSSLSEEQKLCVIMYHIEGQKIKDIACALGCSENTVKSRLTYGRNALRTKCEDLQTKGYQLYSVAPIPLLLYLVKIEGRAYGATAVGEITGGSKPISKGAGNAQVTGGSIAKAGGAAKIVAWCTGGALLLGLICGGVVYFSKNKKHLKSDTGTFVTTESEHESTAFNTATDDVENTVDITTEDSTEEVVEGTTEDSTTEESTQDKLSILYGYDYSVIFQADYEQQPAQLIFDDEGNQFYLISGTVTYFDYENGYDYEEGIIESLSGTTYTYIGDTELHGSGRFERIYKDEQGNEYTTSDAVNTPDIDPLTSNAFRSLYKDNKNVAHKIENVKVLLPECSVDDMPLSMFEKLPDMYLISFDNDGNVSFIWVSGQILMNFENCIYID